MQQQSWHNSNIPPSRCTKVVSKCLYSPSHRDAGGWAPGKGEGASGQAPSSHTLRSTTARKPNPDAGKESILRSLDLGLGGAWCCQCFVDGLCWPGTSYTSAAGPLQVCSEVAWPWPVLLCIALWVGCTLCTIVWCCTGKSCRRGKGDPTFTCTGPGTVVPD